MISRRTALAASIALAAYPLRTLHARSSAAPRSIVEKTIDLRNMSGGVEYSLVFLNRWSERALKYPGHAYMLLGTHDHERNVCDFDAKSGVLGFYPKKKTAGVWLNFKVPGEVRGKIEKDLNEGLITHRLIIRASESHYEAAMAAAGKYRQTDAEYELLGRNCIDFIHDVLTAIRKASGNDDLKVPVRDDILTPEGYLTELLKQNGLQLP